MNVFLYLLIILLWGTTWIAMKAQIGAVPLEVSIVYRFIIAGTVLFGLMLLKRVPFRYNLQQHFVLLMFGTFLFSMNFMFLYRAVPYITSGLVSIIFSTSVVMIMINSKLFFKKTITLRMLIGGLIGVSGLCLIFYPELQSFDLKNQTCLGLLFGLAGTYCFALGNQVSTYCNQLQIPLIASTFWGMCYGVGISTLICLLNGSAFTIDYSAPYLLGLFHLAIPGSVIGFLTYLTLVKRIGPERAVYATLFFPIVALVISSIFESFHWIAEDYIGSAMVLIGNFLVLMNPNFFYGKFNKKNSPERLTAA